MQTALSQLNFESKQIKRQRSSGVQ